MDSVRSKIWMLKTPIQPPSQQHLRHHFPYLGGIDLLDNLQLLQDRPIVLLYIHSFHAAEGTGTNVLVPHVALKPMQQRNTSPPGCQHEIGHSTTRLNPLRLWEEYVSNRNLIKISFANYQ